ncbi:hypothetical protein JYU34_017017 [Plutella xylostella]|uniref:Salivary secreted peptide n=1 Tax=Plutella xylostella TaxID=51655 RepID=A0ABQ7Q418_PLUXY|nr:hypothetical protein JYU34_017017 [Plutella xylostella]
MSLNSVLLVSVLALCAYSAQGYDLQVGSTGVLAYSEKVSLSGIPFTTRTKNVFYTNPGNQLIRGVYALDQDIGSKSKATITSGGVGFPFVNIRLKGTRNDPLTYQVQVFV